MDVKVIMEENKTNFENKLKEYIQNEYKIQSSNVIFLQTQENVALIGQNTIPSGAFKIYTIRKDEKIKNCFYALLIKE